MNGWNIGTKQSQLAELTPELTDVGLYPQVNSEGGFNFVEIEGVSGSGTSFAVDVSTKTGTDTEKIQSALDDGGVIIINKKDALNTPWDITASLEIGSDTTWIINDCELKLADNVDAPILVNSDIVSGNENTHVIGWGSARLNCNGGNQNRLLNDHHNVGIHYYLVDNFSFKDIIIEETAKWGLVTEACNNGYLNNITFDNSGVVNQDGIHIIGPSSDIVCDGVFGTFGDDACVCNGRDNPYQGYSTTGGDVERVIFNNVNIMGNGDGSRTGILRTSAGVVNSVKNVTLSNAIGRNISQGALRLGGGDTSDHRTHRNIIADNVILVSTNAALPDYPAAFMTVIQGVGRVKLNNCVMLADTGNVDPVFVDNNDTLIVGLEVSNCSMEVPISQGGQAFKFKNAAAKDILVNNFTLLCEDTTTGAPTFNLCALADNALINAVFSNVNMENVGNAIQATGTVTPTNVRFENINMRNCDPFFDVVSSNGYVVGGFATESNNAETPTASKYQIGDTVSFTDTGDGSGDGTYIKNSDTTFIKIL